MPPSQEELGVSFVAGHVLTTAPLFFHEAPLGYLVVRWRYPSFLSVVVRYLPVIVGFVVTLLVVCFGVLRVLQRRVGGPIEKLAETVQEVAETRNYSHQVQQESVRELDWLGRGFNSMLREISLHQQYVEGIIESLLDPLFVLTVQGQILSANQAACKLFQWEEKRLSGNTLTQFLVDSQGFEMDCYRRVLEQGTLRNFATNLQVSDGTEIPLILQGSTLKDDTGEVYRLVFVARDMRQIEEYQRKEQSFLIEKDRAIARAHEAQSRLVHMEEAAESIEKAKKEAEMASVARSEFLANMSHEIRTPLNGILGMARILVDMSLDSDAREPIEIIHRAGQDLLVIINDILDFSKIDAGRMELEAAAFRLDTALGDVVELLNESAKAKALFLKFEFDPLLPRRVIGDSARLRQVIRNLVGNAVKFTSVGGVTVRALRLEAPSGGVVRARIEVEDTGIGIAKERQHSIFEVFTQADTSTTRKFGGTGLGLAISKKLVHLMGGELRVQSELGQGSKFHFEAAWPVAPTLTDESTGTDLLATTLEKPVPALRVLLVDDNKVNQMVGVQMLHNLGCQVELAENGVDALHQLEHGSFDMVLMDCHMPEMDGYEATRRIRELPDERAQIPIVAMTAAAMEGDRERCLHAGMDDYISKPVDPERLLEMLYRWGSEGAEFKSTVVD